jgi:hypothetical protein
MILDMDAFSIAAKRGAPFSKALCGRVETRKNLVSIPEFVTCPTCRSLLPAPTPIPEVSNPGMDADITDDLSEFEQDDGAVVDGMMDGDEDGEGSEVVDGDGEVNDRATVSKVDMDGGVGGSNLEWVREALDMLVPESFQARSEQEDSSLLDLKFTDGSERMFVGAIVSAVRSVGSGRSSSYLVEMMIGR